MDRLARYLDDLRSVAQKLNGRAIGVEFVKENLIFTREAAPLVNLMLSVMGAFAEFERALIGECQREWSSGKQGAYYGHKKLFNRAKTEFVRRAGAGDPKTAPAREYGISRETVYQYVRHPAQ